MARRTPISSSISNAEFHKYLGHMHPIELKIKDTSESNVSVSYQDQ